MATEVNPKRVSPLTGETLTNQRIYWQHVAQAQARAANSVEAEPLLIESEVIYTLEHKGAGWYNIILNGEVFDSIRGKEEAEAKLEALNANINEE